MGQSGRCSDGELSFVLDNLVSTINKERLVSRCLDKSYSLVGFAAGLGLARHFRVPILDQELISLVGSTVGSLLQKSAR